MVNGKPAHAAKFLRGIDFPVTKDDLINHATQQGADEHALATLGRLPAQTFEGPFGLSKAFGEIGHEERAFAHPTLLAAQGTFEKFTFQGTAGSRDYFVYTPANYQLGTAVPLLLMLHGCTENPEVFADITQMNQLADQNQFIVVYPQQTSGDNPEECWNWFVTSDQSRDSGEPSILAGITQTVLQNTTHWTIDPKRVYVAGLSAGACMTVILGATYPDLFAAIGAHSGVEYEAATSQENALLAMSQGGPDPMLQGQVAFHAMGNFARVVPTIVFQGTNDRVVRAVNGDQVTRQWMETNQLASHGAFTPCFNKPSSTMSGQVPGGRSFMVRTWKDSSGKVVQSYWTVNGMDHAWSGGTAGKPYSDPKGPNASLAMYQFFLAHPHE
jgi:poly(hydroxyalkanoate) depolymerase family esterase